MAEAKRKNIIGHEVSADGKVITFTVLGAGSFQVDRTKLSIEVEDQAAIHGLIQKISDKAAISRDADTGRSASPKEKYEAMFALAEHLQNGGSWVMKAVIKALNRGALVQAVLAVRTTLDPVRVGMVLAAKSDAELRAYLTHSAIAAEYARLTAPAVSASDAELFGDLEQVSDEDTGQGAGGSEQEAA